jgi:hypothetical protein
MTEPTDDGSSEDGDAKDGAGPGPRTDDVGRVLRQGVKAALARWVLAKRRGSGRADAGAASAGAGAGPHGGVTPSPHDEATHAWDGRRRFAEDYTFGGVQAGLGVVLRLEHLPGRDCRRVWVTVLRPAGAWTLPGGQLLVRTAGEDRWRAGGLSLDCERPLERWALRFGGTLEHVGPGGDAPPLHVVGRGDETRARASIDLTFVATARPHVPGTDDDPELLARCLSQASWDARLLRAVRRDRTHGYVQLGELHGTIALGDALVPVRAAALRQHRWGVRDFGACDDAYECFWATDDERRGWVHHARFPFVTLDGGFATARGTGRAGAGERRLEAVRRLGATLEARPRRAPARASMAVGEADGTRHVQLETVSDVSFVVDGRGRVDLALMRVTGPTPGWALWGGLRRTLPRR